MPTINQTPNDNKKVKLINTKLMNEDVLDVRKIRTISRIEAFDT